MWRVGWFNLVGLNRGQLAGRDTGENKARAPCPSRFANEKSKKVKLFVCVYNICVPTTLYYKFSKLSLFQKWTYLDNPDHSSYLKGNFFPSTEFSGFFAAGIRLKMLTNKANRNFTFE